MSKIKGKKNKFFQGDLELLRKQDSDPFVIKEGSFHYGRLKDESYQTSWVENSFLLEGQEGEVIGHTFDSNILKLIKIIIFSLFAILLIRIAFLQIVKGRHYLGLAEGNRMRVENIEAKRGIIYDRNGLALVKNTANFALYLVPIDLPKDELERDAYLRRLSDIIDGDLNSLSLDLALDKKLVDDKPFFKLVKESLSKIKTNSLEAYQALFIKDNIDYDKAVYILVNERDFPGVLIETKIRREYPQVLSYNSGPGIESLSHILGYTGKITAEDIERLDSPYGLSDYVGKISLEYYWEEELKGTKGKKNYEVDAFGRKLKIINESKTQDGLNLELSLDLALQAKVEEILKKYLERIGASKASVVILDPNNGEILALVSLPAYDNNLFAHGFSQTQYLDYIEDPKHSLFNRAISGEFPSGSTIKPLISAAALEEGIITRNTQFLSTGGLSLGQWFFPDWKAGGHGLSNVEKAIAESVNTFFYYIGGGYQDFNGLGLENINKYMKLFGLGEKSGIDLNGEAKGLVPDQEWKREKKNEAWYIGDTYHISIGQGDLLSTPLQMANITATIANGGTLYEPHLVSRLLDEENNLVKKIEAKIIRENFISPENIRIVQEGMRQAVTMGSARNLSLLNFSSAGKTGTAQWSSKHKNHAWFTAFAPYENPKLALSVLIEEGGEGSEVAVPIAREILDWYFSR